MNVNELSAIWILLPVDNEWAPEVLTVKIPVAGSYAALLISCVDVPTAVTSKAVLYAGSGDPSPAVARG